MSGLRLSGRLDWESGEVPLFLECNALRVSGGELFDLACTDPTSVGLELPWGRIGSALSQHNLWCRYRPLPQGSLKARQALARLYAGWGEEISPEQIFLASSTSEVYSWLFQLLCDPGDTILVPTPGYPLFEESAALAGAQSAPAPLEWCGGRWCYTPRSWRVPARTRALVIVAPHNPTGALPTVEEWREIASFCRLHRLVLIVDEVFRLSYCGGDREVVDWEEMALPVVVLSGLSKWLAAPQLKLSWARLYGTAGEVEKLSSALEHAADACLNLSAPVQVALPELLKLIDPVSSLVLERLEENRAAIRSQLEGVRGLTIVDEGRAWYSVLQLERGDEESFALSLLREKSVFLHPGYFYDFSSPSSHLVVGMLTPPPLFSKGLSLLLQHLVEKSVMQD